MNNLSRQNTFGHFYVLFTLYSPLLLIYCNMKYIELYWAIDKHNLDLTATGFVVYTHIYRLYLWSDG